MVVLRGTVNPALHGKHCQFESDRSHQNITEMNTLIVGDIHNRTSEFEEILVNIENKTKLVFDEIVFVGDYFDRFHDSVDEAGRTAAWLKKSLEDPKRVHLIGNHDMPYMSPANPYVQCPGWTPSKSRMVNSVMTKEDWDKIKAVHYTQGFMVSHAGFREALMTHPILGRLTPDQLVTLAVEELEKVKGIIFSPLFDYKKLNSNQQVELGGITWLRWYDFKPVEGLNQIVGHTPGLGIRMEGNNFCVDCHMDEVLVISDGNPLIIVNVKSEDEPEPESE